MRSRHRTKPRGVALALGLAAAALGSPAVASAQACERVPVRAAHAQVIGRDLLVNGTPSAIWALGFDVPAEQVAREFRAYWQRERLPAAGVSGPQGVILSGFDGNCQYLLTLPPGQQGSGSRGVMSVSALDATGARHAIHASVAALPQGRVLSDVESRDPARAGRTWVIALAGRADGHARRYQDRLARAGWTTVSSRAVPREGAGGGAGNAGVWGGASEADVSLAMQKGAYRLDAVFAGRNGQATAVINVMESG